MLTGDDLTWEHYEAFLHEDLVLFLGEAFAIIEPGLQLIESWHLEHLAYMLMEMAAGRQRRLIITVPPRSLKSILISVILPAFLMGRDPTLKIIVASNTRELARKHASDFRRLTESDLFRRVFPKFQIATAGNRIFEQRTTLNGHRIATSVGATITGQGADIIIIDDPNRAKDIYSVAHRDKVKAYYDQELFTRLNDKQRGRIIIVMQRLHQDDLVGHVTERGTWTTSSIPVRATETTTYALGPNRSYVRPAGDILMPSQYTEEVLEDIRATTGSINFEAQYQQNPAPAEGQIIKRKWLCCYDTRATEYEFICCSWDLASTIEETSDYSVGTVWGRVGQEFHLLEVLRGRFEAPDLRRMIEQTHLQYVANVTVIENAGIGAAIGAEMRRQSRIRPLLLTPRLDKQARLIAEAPKFEAGQVILPREAPWLGSYLNELLSFPASRNDDQVDSTSQALKYMTSKMPRAEIAEEARKPRPDKPRPAGRLGRRN